MRETETFGELLGRFRRRKGLTQQALAAPEMDLSVSYITKLESGNRGNSGQVALRRDQVWHLVKFLDLWPPDCDLLLESASLSSDRSEAEEREIQQHFDFKELWVFARVILDADDEWSKVVAKNLARGIVYRYFTASPPTFENLRRKLSVDFNEATLNLQLECTVLPLAFFMMNFAIYLTTDKRRMYCCGTKSEYGKAERFFTMADSETDRLYEQLRDWKSRLDVNMDIELGRARRSFPPGGHVSRFIDAGARAELEGKKQQ